MSRTKSTRRRAMAARVFAIAILCVVMVWASSAHAAVLGRALRQTMETMQRSSDEAIAGAGRAIETMAHHGDEALERLGRSLDPGDGLVSVDEAAARLVRVGMDAGAARALAQSLDGASRRALSSVLDQSQRVVRLAGEGGMKPGAVVDALAKAGDDALPTVRGMTSADSTVACLRGMDRFGERFIDFARKGDEAVVVSAGKHLDDLAGLPVSKVDDVLKNPMKYFDANGRPLRALDDVLATAAQTGHSGTRALGKGAANAADAAGDTAAGARRGVRAPGMRTWMKTGVTGAVIASAVVALCPDQWIDDLPLPEPVKEFIKDAKWYIRAGWSLFLLWFLWPVVIFVVRILRRILMMLAGLVPGSVGRASRRSLSSRAARREIEPPSFMPAYSATGGQPPLRIGLLGSRRAGKSTFIVMLTKFLDRLVEGASLRPHALNPDQELLDRITKEVAHCLPTEEEKSIQLDLSWPFRRDGVRCSGGKLSHALHLTDFPGEWASTTADPTVRAKLIDHLRRVDGLLVVIDPTDLETEADGADRTSHQRKTLEAMFLADGLDLSRSFRRAMAVVITKRDAITPKMLQRWIARSDVKYSDETIRDMLGLLKRSQLNDRQSQRLGQLLVNLICPGFFAAVRGQMASVQATSKPKYSRAFWRRSRPQLAVFATAQLGIDLGHQVIQHRRRVMQWESEGREGERPRITLDLENVRPSQLEVHLPFRWLFNHIPAGMLHQALSMSGRSRRKLLSRTHQRFAGAPEVARSKRVTRNRLIVGLVAAILFGFTVQPVGHFVQAQSDSSEVSTLYRAAASGTVQDRELEEWAGRCRALETKPDPAGMNLFDQILSAKNLLHEQLPPILEESLSRRERIDAALKWIHTCGDIPEVDASWPIDLVTFRDLVTAPTDRVTETLLTLIDETCDELIARKQFQDAIDLLAEATRITGDDLPPPTSGRAQRDLFAYEQRVREAKCNELLAALRSDVTVLCDAENYLTAARAIAVFKIDERLEQARRRDLTTRLASLRAGVNEQFWSFTKVKTLRALSEGDPAEAKALLDTFEQLPAPNEYASAAALLRADMPEKLVDAACRTARAAFEDGQPGSAWLTLQEVRTSVDAATEETQQQWYRAAADASEGDGQWSRALSLLDAPAVATKAWTRQRRDELWQRWGEALVSEFPALRDAGEIDQIKRRVAEFRADDADCPTNVSDRVAEKVEREIPRANITTQMERAEQLAALDPQTAIEILVSLWIDVPRTDESSTPLITRWRTTLVALYQRTGQHRRAIDLIQRWREDDSLHARAPVSDEQIQQLWDAYAADVMRLADASLREGQEPDAWRALLAAYSADDMPEIVQRRLREHTADQLGKRMALRRKMIAQLCDQDDFTGARAEIARIRDDVSCLVSQPVFSLPQQIEEMAASVDRSEIDDRITRVQRLTAEGRFEEGRRYLTALEADIASGAPDRPRIDEMVEKNLTAWEKSLYEDVREARDHRDYDRLSDLVDEYLRPDSPLGSVRTATRIAAVSRLRAWLEQFDRITTYRVTSVEYFDFPDYYNDYDPVFLLRIGATDRKQIVRSRCTSAANDGRVDKFETNQSFTWKKGDPIVIEIWDNKEGGYRIGVLTIRETYALPRLSLDRHPVPYTTYDYRDDENLAKVRFRVNVSGCNELPALPPYTQS